MIYCRSSGDLDRQVICPRCEILQLFINPPPLRALSQHSTDARVYGHTTTAMYKMSTPPPIEYVQWLDSVGTDAVKHYMYIGVGVGWQRCCRTCQSLRELDSPGTVFFFLAVTMVVIELDRIVRGGEP